MKANRQQDENRAMLHRIVALLFALADLAECAASRPAALRQLVLWILYPAESVARNLVVNACGPVALPPRAASSAGGPADAQRLAMCLRCLAFMLEAVAGWCADADLVLLVRNSRVIAAFNALGAVRPRVRSACPSPDTS